MAKAQHPACRLVTIKDDKGAEFIGKQIAAWQQEHGIQAQHTVRATPEQNRRAEYGFRDLAEGATCILARAGMAVSWWPEAAHASSYVYNRFPHRAPHCAPSSCGMATSPISPICVSGGCLPYVHLQIDQREEPKHDAHTRLCTFIAYRDDYEGWEFLVHETVGRVVSWDAQWQENAFTIPR
jgi:hypothetical protein